MILPLAIIAVSLVVMVLVWRLPTTSKAELIENKNPKPGENAKYWRMTVSIGNCRKVLIMTAHEFDEAIRRGHRNPEDWE
jgi:hypothetical protein